MHVAGDRVPVSRKAKAKSGASSPPPRHSSKPGAQGGILRKRPVLSFVVLFGVLMGLFYLATLKIEVLDKTVLPAYMRLNAKVSAGILNVFGEGATARGTSVSSSRYSVDIAHGCDAVEPSALFVAAVLAFPAAVRFKLTGTVIGVAVLAGINLVRIVTLFYTGIHFPRWFETMHVDVWQPVFILLALTFWVAWAWWATRDGTGQRHVAG